MVWSDLSLAEPEPFKSEVNREVGKAVSARIGKVVDFKHPELVAHSRSLDRGTVEVQINSVFFYGRYQKFERGIPQTHWDCRACQGAGCEKCNFTGAQYLDSVEELIGRPVIAAFDAENAVLHGAGREDIDARMIGTRPTVHSRSGLAKETVHRPCGTGSGDQPDRGRACFRCDKTLGGPCRGGNP